MRLADAHLHLFRRGFPGRYGRSLLAPDVEVYEALRAAHGIAAGLVVGYEGDGVDPDNNASIRELAAERPWMATLAYTDAQRRPSPHRMAGLLDAGHAGVALYLLDQAAADAASAWPTDVWRVLAERDVLVSLNVSPEFLGPIAPAAAQNPGCRFLVSHLGLPGSYREPPTAAEAAARLAPLLALADLPNVFIKISGAYAVSDPYHAYPHEAATPFADLILERFGTKRCLWGSDFSPALDYVSFAQTLWEPWANRLDAGERADVMGGNLLRLLGREPGA